MSFFMSIFKVRYIRLHRLVFYKSMYKLPHIINMEK